MTEVLSNAIFILSFALSLAGDAFAAQREDVPSHLSVQSSLGAASTLEQPVLQGAETEEEPHWARALWRKQKEERILNCWWNGEARKSRAMRVAAGLLLLSVLTSSWAAQPLVDVKWLMANLNKPNIVVLDLQPAEIHARVHLPGAINSSYAEWRKPNGKGTPQMIPSVSELETLIGGLGIDNQTHVVLVVTGRDAGDMASAARVYWSFKALGHDEVSILDGGLIAYANGGNPLERRINAPRKRNFKARLRPAYLLTAAAVKASLDNGVTVIDSRSGAEFMGLARGSPEERPGTIPGSIHLPFDWLTINGGAHFHGEENLRRIYRAAGAPLTGRQISFCHTGHRTSLSWFVSHELLGNHEAGMYDGSMAEWAVDHSLPMAKKIVLN